MIGVITFSLVGTILFALVALGLVWLLAALGDGQRVRVAGGRPQGGTVSRRPRRPAAQRSRR